MIYCPKCSVPMPFLTSNEQGMYCEDCSDLAIAMAVIEQKVQGFIDLEQQLVTLTNDINKVKQYCPF